MSNHAPRDRKDITSGDPIASTPEDARENVEAERLAADDSTVPGEEQPAVGSTADDGESTSQPPESDEAADDSEKNEDDEGEDEKSSLGQPSVMPGTNGAVAGTAFEHLVDDDEKANRNPAVAKQLESNSGDDR
ncbi:hypothetical protein [Lolliginicoccus levis]|uniref:hypothetical protein n=1 Tax=Lolliginicoccus levis TaxID=2919542 RepID=UPI00241EDF2A|nr:hypothetical protein [Lolliginicoccus levis]